jgi:HPt (histidine-containing phosphotransfer) domain-containing protein
MTVNTDACPVDLKDGLARAGDDRDFYKELLQMFVDDAQHRLEQLASAIQAEDSAAITSLAHSIKGAAANLSANAVRDLAYSIEMRGRAGQTCGYQADLTKLQAEIVRIERFTEQF